MEQLFGIAIMTKPYRSELMERFLREEDRNINHFFTGREDILQAIQSKALAVNEQTQAKISSSPAAGLTQIIQGPPGVGKTSLLEKIRQDSLKVLKENKKGHKTIPVMITNPRRLSYETLGKRIAETITELSQELGSVKNIDKIKGSLKAVSSIGIPGIVEVDLDGTRTLKKKNLVPEGYTIILMIDEIQNIPPDKDSEAAMVLESLHGGSDGYPILPVVAGLSSSRGILTHYAFSRLGGWALHNVPTLTANEVRESFEKFIGYFNIRSDKDTTRIWSDFMVDWSGGWPKHLQNTMAVLGRFIHCLKDQGNLTIADPHLVKKAAFQKKTEYYKTRCGLFDSMPVIIGEIMAEVGSIPKSQVEIVNISRDIYMSSKWKPIIEELDFPVPNFHYLLHNGFIDNAPEPFEDCYHCPIPSLQSFIVATTGSGIHTAVYEGDEGSIRPLIQRGHDINGQDAWGRTPLHIAAENNWDRVVAVLLQEGADPEIRDQQNNRPLELAREDSASHLKLMRVSVAIKDNNPTDTQQSKLTENQSVSSRPKM